MGHKDVWCLFFAGVVSFQFHPGAGTKEHRRLSIPECGAVADAMLLEFVKREEVLWRGSGL